VAERVAEQVTMSRLDAESVRASLGDLALRQLERFEAFAAIESTNSYLMQDAPPAPGGFRVALTDNQTAGRGRHGRTWQSPPGAGLCLSVAYTFAASPRNLPALTLAIGLGLIDALDDLGIGGISLKWPNDLIANDGKLGGILTESQALGGGSIHVVSGVGLNVDLPGDFDLGAEAERAQPVADLGGLVDDLPSPNVIAACLVDGVCGVFVDYEARGFEAFVGRWRERDWLRGRELTIDGPPEPVTGTGAGVADDGALLVAVGGGTIHQVTSGTVVVAGNDGAKL
jgi:BirA family biotin operon repressor/biotin-[acetyl-CoA-carboxylase] ligase